MDGFHDLGGVQGFGTIPHTINSLDYKKVFKQDWEHLAYTLMFLGADHMKLFSVDEVRHAVERIEFRQHATTQYYERYVTATASLMVEQGVITQEELNAALGSYFKLAAAPKSNGRAAITGRPPFEIGDRVVVRDERVTGHIRAPGYVRGKQGVVVHRTTEQWPFPDTIGHGDKSAVLQPSYHVEFNTRDVWGDACDAGFVVVDLFEGYLDKVTTEATVPAARAVLKVAEKSVLA